MYNIPKTYHIGGEKVLDTILHMIAHINIFSHFWHNSEFDHAALLIRRMTRQFSETYNLSR